MTTAFGAKIPQYSTVLDLDRKIRDFPVPWRLRIKCGLGEGGEPTKAVHMQRWFVMSCKEASKPCESCRLPLCLTYVSSSVKPPSTILRTSAE